MSLHWEFCATNVKTTQHVDWQPWGLENRPKTMGPWHLEFRQVERFGPDDIIAVINARYAAGAKKPAVAVSR